MMENEIWPLVEDSSFQSQGHAWCEAMSLEGLYRKDDGGTLEILEKLGGEVDVFLLKTSFFFFFFWCFLVFLAFCSSVFWGF